jgi:hypothetical protein
MCSFPAVDRGITPRGFVSSIIVADSEGFCKGVGEDFQIWVCRGIFLPTVGATIGRPPT